MGVFGGIGGPNWRDRWLRKDTEELTLSQKQKAKKDPICELMREAIPPSSPIRRDNSQCKGPEAEN